MVYLEALISPTVDPLETRAKPELVTFAQALVDAWSTLGLCAFLAFGMLPENPRPMSAFNTIAGRLALRSGPALRFALRYPRLLNAVPVPFGMLPYLHLLRWLTGMKLGLGDFLEAGLRINTQERLFNVREGQGASEDRLSHRLTSELQTSNPLSRVPIARMLPDAYRAKGWDASGCPTAGTLRRLSLEGLT
jgi:aldehyde:ferredoxin oxidoreductase